MAVLIPASLPIAVPEPAAPGHFCRRLVIVARPLGPLGLTLRQRAKGRRFSGGVLVLLAFLVAEPPDLRHDRLLLALQGLQLLVETGQVSSSLRCRASAFGGTGCTMMPRSRDQRAGPSISVSTLANRCFFISRKGSPVSLVGIRSPPSRRTCRPSARSESTRLSASPTVPTPSYARRQMTWV